MCSFVVRTLEAPQAETLAWLRLLLRCDVLSSLNSGQASTLLTQIIPKLVDSAEHTLQVICPPLCSSPTVRSDLALAMQKLKCLVPTENDASKGTDLVASLASCLSTLAACLKEAVTLDLFQVEDMMNWVETLFALSCKVLGLKLASLDSILVSVVDLLVACSTYFLAPHAEHCLANVLELVKWNNNCSGQDELLLRVACLMDSCASSFDDFEGTAIWSTVCETWIAMLASDGNEVVKHALLSHFRSFAKSLGLPVQSLFETMCLRGGQKNLQQVHEFLAIHAT
eukprot:scaffold517_cov392-Prasinococcus_capsulatus_cf.AAC.16